MEQLLTSSDIAKRYQCSLESARTYMRKMEHQECPLRVTESALMAWELSRTQMRGSTVQNINLIVPRTR